MNQEIPVGPPSSDYIKSNLQIWFSYLPGHKSFNFGHFGINEASITGVLHLRSTIIQPLIINSVKVKFVGEETKGWAKPETLDYESKGNFEETCNIIVGLWESQEFKKVTSWDLPFSIPLPKNLPPSMSYGNDKDNKILFVRYRLMALVGEVTAEKIISVKINLTKYHLRPIMNPPLIMSGDSSRCLEYDIRLNKTTYDHGETAKISMNLFLLNRRVKFKEIEICLKEYFVHGLSIKKNKSRRLITKIISGKDIQNSLDGLEWITDISLKLPSYQDEEKPLLCDIDISGKKPMKILHKIKIKIKTNKGIFGNISLEKRINIKNYISKKTNTTNNDPTDPTQEISEKESSTKPTVTRSVSFNEPDRFDDLPPPSYNASSLPLPSKISKPPPYAEPSRRHRRKKKNHNVVSPSSSSSSSSSSYLSKIEKTVNNLLLFKTMNSDF